VRDSNPSREARDSIEAEDEEAAIEAAKTEVEDRSTPTTSPATSSDDTRRWKVTAAEA
jgi:hypothetical protein